MQRIPVTIRDLNVLLTAELSVSRELASAIAGKLNSGIAGVDRHSACMISWYDGEDAIFFDYSAGERRYAAVLLLLYYFPVISGKKQRHILRMLKKHASFREYEDIQCMLIVPECLPDTQLDLAGYPFVMSWNILAQILHQCGGRGEEYLAEMLKIAAEMPEGNWFENGLVLN